MTRDDIDRLVVLAASFALPLLVSLADENLAILTVTLFWPTLLLGAFAFFRDASWARAWLIGVGVVWLVISTSSALRDVVGLSAVAASGAMLIAVLRARIPPPAPHSAVGGFDYDADAGSRPFHALRDWRDDPDLRAFAARAGRLDTPDLAYLAAAWRSGDARPRDAAHRAVREALRDGHRAKAFDAISAEIRAWSQAAVGPWTWEWGAMTDIDRGDRRRAAIPALLDAAAAIITRDAIADEDREALLAPWTASLAAGQLSDDTAPRDAAFRGDADPTDGTGLTPATS